MGCSFLVWMEFPLLAGSLLRSFIVVVKTRCIECQHNQEQDSAWEDGIYPLNESEMLERWALLEESLSSERV